MTTLTKARAKDIEGLKLQPACTGDHLNSKLFKHCVDYDCLPMISEYIDKEHQQYYIIHYEDVALISCSPMSKDIESFQLVKQWLDEHHQSMAIYERLYTAKAQ